MEGTINIERTSPYTNDDSGSYSFPFPVPRIPNQQNLNWPGMLQRVGDVEVQSFILEEDGIQLLRGEIDYDEISRDEIGMILKSGHTAFRSVYDGRKLSSVYFGVEWWPYLVSVDEYGNKTFQDGSWEDKLTIWDEANTTDNGIYVASPFYIGDSLVNKQNWNGPGNSYLAFDGNQYYFLVIDETTPEQKWHYEMRYVIHGLFCLQFKVSFLIRKPFINLGYEIVADDFIDSKYGGAIIFGKVIVIEYDRDTGREVNPHHYLVYSDLMPDMELLTFMDLTAKFFCLVYEIDELKKEVKIKFKKDIFLAENISQLKVNELEGWNHQEIPAAKGFVLEYGSQTEPRDTEYEYTISLAVDSVLPAASKEGDVIRQNRTGRDFITVLNDQDILEWKQIGRLKHYKEGEGETVVTLDTIKIPPQMNFIVNGANLECPVFGNILNTYKPGPVWQGGFFIDIPLAISVYRGRILMSGMVYYPVTTFDFILLDGIVNYGWYSLTPTQLYLNCYSEYLNWKAYRARPFTKYIELTMAQVLTLQWGKRYVINGVLVILDTINYELPYWGVVEVKGFTG